MDDLRVLTGASADFVDAVAERAEKGRRVRGQVGEIEQQGHQAAGGPAVVQVAVGSRVHGQPLRRLGLGQGGGF